jgi:hypothetical protein
MKIDAANVGHEVELQVFVVAQEIAQINQIGGWDFYTRHIRNLGIKRDPTVKMADDLFYG